MSVALLALALVAKLYAVAKTGYWRLLPYVLESWRTVLLAALGLSLVLARRLEPGFFSLSRMRAHGVRWAVGLVTVAAVLVPRAPTAYPNAFGLATEQPNHRSWTDVGHPYRPPAYISTNDLGFRDRIRSRRPSPGTVRVVVVGDSYVFGSGIPDAQGTIDRQLERTLQASVPGRSWQVLNAGFPGWGLVTYFEVARRLIRGLHPRVVVIATIGGSDWDLLDPQQVFEIFGPTGYRLLGALGVVEDLRDSSKLLSREVSLSRYWYGEDRLAAALRALVDDAEASGIDVVVWEYYDPLPLFAAVEGRPRFRRVGWPVGFDRSWDGWGSDPELAIPGDHHPTAKANRLIADRLASTILEITGEAPAPSSGVSGAMK